MDPGQLECGDGRALIALDVLSREKIDILLSDIGIPGMDGFELIRRVRQLDGGTLVENEVDVEISFDARSQNGA